MAISTSIAFVSQPSTLRVRKSVVVVQSTSTEQTWGVMCLFGCPLKQRGSRLEMEERNKFRNTSLIPGSMTPILLFRHQAGAQYPVLENRGASIREALLQWLCAPYYAKSLFIFYNIGIRILMKMK